MRPRRSEPPGPAGEWLGGNLAAYEADRLEFLLRAREQFGDVVRFGPRTTILNAPLEVVRLLREPLESLTIEENFLQRRLTAAQGREAVSVRRVLNPGLRPSASASIASTVQRHVDKFIWAVEQGRNRWFDPLPALESSISAAVAEYYFGSEADELPPLVGDLLDELSKVIGNPLALPAGWRSPVRRRIDLKYRDLRCWVVSGLEARRDAAGGFGDLAADIAARGTGSFSTERLADVVIGSLLASQRVPAAAASWMLMLMADHPAIQESVREESTESARVAGTVAARPDRGGLAAAVVLESLRLYPPTWLLVRTAARTVSVAGYDFHRGHHFMVSPYVMHRDPVSFPDPDVFRPDRWATMPTVPPGYFPYGGGIHICPGRHLATTILVTLLQSVVRSRQVVRMPGAVRGNPRTTLLPENLLLGLRRHAEAESLAACPAIHGHHPVDFESAPR